MSKSFSPIGLEELEPRLDFDALRAFPQGSFYFFPCSALPRIILTRFISISPLRALITQRSRAPRF
jgi:hypothetical protein